ncbi:putative peptide transport fused subunits of ABC superfamily: ATP-binding components [Vibrio nigripulchritudo SOn1]|uniref:Peptide transport fused subunits of ABC superfamily: ATP-binding components n=1 Tax=Vibrio nigripulchritudo SOn1 TaxID=1238450 RepID=A0AAV2VZW6_9VIBR|nr:ABC transporter ATP-binding protein [Vibrio nigripulchritudo]CCO50305.1 putative peptide transport fused subunits of ABC superfamily: ATP-binding components [Vibrio nigripulchritudo SOn1]
MTSHLLEVRNLSVTFHTAKGPVEAVKNVSWHLDRSEVLAILGESGSGKSVSAATIMDLLDMPPAEIVTGEVLFDDQDLLTASPEFRREINGKRIAMIFQDPLAHLNPVYTVGWQIAEIMIIHGLSRGVANKKVIELLEKVGIPEPQNAVKKYPHQFSGGQRQRIMIAMALAFKPDVIIADEPTTALDVTVQSQILSLLKELREETGMGLLIITHDLGVVAEIADRVVVMCNGEVVETGDTAAVYHSPRHPYTKKLISSAPGKGDMSNGVEHLPVILRLNKLNKSYGNFQALESVSFNLREGETIAIVGESGSGKSTTAKLLMGLEEPSGGQAFYKGKDIFAMSKQELMAIRREIQMVFQDPSESLNPRMSVFQLISEPWVVHPDILNESHWEDQVSKLLEQVGLKQEHMYRYPHQFSGGQRQRIAIARALAMNPKIIVCDEAVSALDVSIQAQVINLLSSLQKTLGISFIFIAHDLPVVRDFADKVIVMQSGRIVEAGSVKDIFDNPQEPYTQALLAASLDPDPFVQAERRGYQSNVTPHIG